MSEAAVLPNKVNDAAPASPAGAVLIVDDEAEIRESLQTLLEMEGYEVETAATGQQGLNRIGQRPFDLILLDLALPDRNGMEILTDLLAQDPALSVIMITAYGTVENAVKAMQAGAANFVQKPWDNEKLLADVRAAIARRRAEEALQLRKHRRQERGDAEDFRPGGASGPQPLDGPAAGRKRHGQGTHRQGDSPEFAEAREAIRAGEHRLHAARPAGVHALRSRQGRLHQRGCLEERSVRSCRQRDAVPR